LDIHNLTDLIANQGFPIALSIPLIFRIDKFMQEIVTAQKEGYRQILENTKEIHNTITSLNQQNREYYSLRFSEAQKELSVMKAKLWGLDAFPTTRRTGVSPGYFSYPPPRRGIVGVGFIRPVFLSLRDLFLGRGNLIL